jgi:LacI family transcriptional regulator
MEKGRCTAEDVARAAGVSMMTVSRAMNGRPGLGKDTKARVIEAAERLGYRPSKAARTLASRRSSSLGMVMPDIANPFFSTLAKAAIDVARAAGRSVFVMNTDEDSSMEMDAIEELRGEEIDGVIVAGSRLSDARLLEAVAPFGAAVLVNRNCSRGSASPRIGCVNVDDRRGAAEALAYLASSGRRRIGLLTGPRTASGTKRRLAGYRDGLARAGLAYDGDRVERCVPTAEGGASAAAALIARCPELDAIMAYNDLAAIGVLRAMEEAGRSVPGDVAVMGNDDIPYAALVRPALSTVRADIARLGAEAMTLLLAISEGGDVPEFASQIPSIVARESA